MRNRQSRSEFPNVPRTVLGGAAIFSWTVQENRFCGDETFAAIFGMDKVEVAAGLPIEQYLHYVNPDERARVSRSIHHSLVTSDPCAQDYEIWRKNGSRLWVTAVARCFRDEAGEPSEYIGYMYPHRHGAEDCEFLKRHYLDLIDLAQIFSDSLPRADVLRLVLAAVDEISPERPDRIIRH
ncbi:PAS domain-containing protein [Agrobacterium tumefaciens]|uniref:PAS domain-containing protein n=1 Tax=Agrobacterium tumefaciens TaxID=358 RepID=UPI00287DDC0F|nr:PAS domain-containing protein [Agrobacterium tumefaciens]MDS7594234.1 PAS domain-containing protein [Agrobacterium tumefaciens]